VSPRERYLRELERRLPFALGLRRRAVAEVREHLHDGGEDVLARFGTVEELAGELGQELRVGAAARASWLVPAVVAAFVVPFYAIPENAFPPAPWVSVPDYLAWKHDAALVAFAVAVGAAFAAALLGRLWPRIALVPLALAVVALGVAGAFASVLDAQWIDEVPGTSAWLVYGVIVPARVVLVGAAAALFLGAGLRDGRRELTAD
jgi:hypothetical protein